MIDGFQHRHTPIRCSLAQLGMRIEMQPNVQVVGLFHGDMVPQMEHLHNPPGSFWLKPRSSPLGLKAQRLARLKLSLCQIQREATHLVVDGIPGVWPRTKLLPQSRSAFAVLSLPFTIFFEVSQNGAVIGFSITGPELLEGKVERHFIRIL